MKPDYCDCRIPLDSDGLHCGRCNLPINPSRLKASIDSGQLKFCTMCGTRLSLEVNYCGICGNEIVQKSQKLSAGSDPKIIRVSEEFEGSTPEYSNKATFAAVAFLIIFLGSLFGLSNIGSGSSGEINAEDLVPKIEKVLQVKFRIDQFGKVADPDLDKWYAPVENRQAISLLFYTDSEKMFASKYLEDYVNNSQAGGYYCETFAFFGDSSSDVRKVYKVLVENYPDCKVEENSSESDSSGEESYAPGSVADSGNIVKESSNLPECIKLGNTLDGGLRIDPNGGNHWGVPSGKPGYCILPNSGGAKIYYSGE